MFALSLAKLCPSSLTLILGTFKLVLKVAAISLAIPIMLKQSERFGVISKSITVSSRAK